MARMSLKAESARLYLSYLWWLIEPLLYVAVFYVVFDLLLGSERADFLAFLMCGKLTFVWFSKSVVQASRTIVASKGLIGKLDLPKSLFPLASVQEGLYRQAVVFLLLLTFLLLSGYTVTPVWLWLPALMLVNYLLIVTASLIGAYLVCLVFDFSLLISLAMIFLLFTSGIFWDVRELPDPVLAQWVVTINPLAFLVDAYRQVLMFGHPPALGHLLLLGIGAAACCYGALVVMKRSSRFLALRAITA